LAEGFCLLPCFDTQHVLVVLKRVNPHLPDNAMGLDAEQGLANPDIPAHTAIGRNSEKMAPRDGFEPPT
jgi:hypothetical protein